MKVTAWWNRCWFLEVVSDGYRTVDTFETVIELKEAVWKRGLKVTRWL